MSAISRWILLASAPDTRTFPQQWPRFEPDLRQTPREHLSGHVRRLRCLRQAEV